MLSGFSNSSYITLPAQEEPAVAQLASPLGYFISPEFFSHGACLGMTTKTNDGQKEGALHTHIVSTFLFYHSSRQKRPEMQACCDERRSQVITVNHTAYSIQPLKKRRTKKKVRTGGQYWPNEVPGPSWGSRITNKERFNTLYTLYIYYII
jgi:hypothetical protein